MITFSQRLQGPNTEIEAQSEWHRLGEKEIKHLKTYGSFDLGIRVPSSFIRSLILNLRLLSTVCKQRWSVREGKTTNTSKQKVEMDWNINRQKKKRKIYEHATCMLCFWIYIVLLHNVCSKVNFWCYGIHIQSSKILKLV